MHDKVTIAIPTLNRAEYLRIALDSALAQSYSNLEVVVSNNACTDHTTSVLKSMSDPRLNVLEQEHTLSMMENWNACLRAASGKYFLLLSDDDVLEPTAIEEMVDAFEDSERQGKSIGFVYCGGRMIDQDGRTLSLGTEVPSLESAKELILAFFESKRNLWPCVILYRKDDLAPGYDICFPLGADAAQWMRAVVAYGYASFVNRTLACYRVHQNMTAQTRVDVWRKENTALSEFAICELQRKGDAGDDISRTIRRAVSRLNVRITAGLINRSHSEQRLLAISEYCANFKVFCSIYGLAFLMKGAAFLMMPESCRRLGVWRQKMIMNRHLW
jgi:glycosyltransferase involved in cell wall biosynthesis